MKKEVKVEEVKEIKYPHEALENIENVRADFIKRYKKHDALKKVVFGVLFVIMLVFLIIGNKIAPQGLEALFQLGVPIIAVAIMGVYSVFVKKMMNGKMREFFNAYYKGINEFVLDGKGFENVSLAEPGKITKEEFIENQIYKDIYDVASRGRTEFKYNKIPMFVIDAAANVKGEKRIYPCFVGKYLVGESTHKEKAPVIAYLKGTGTVLPPTNVEGLKKVVDNDKMTIFSNSRNWNKVFTPKVVKLLESIKTNKLLVDLTIAVHNSKVYVAMGYDDPIMIPPFEHQFDPAANIQYKGELAQVLKVMEALH